MKYKNKNCLRCGLEYSPNSPTQKYCENCREICYKEKMKEYYLKNKKKKVKQMKEYYLKNKEKLDKKHIEYYYENRSMISKQMKEWKLEKNYGLTVKKYNKMLKKQKGFCPICLKKINGNNKNGRRKANVDHNHKTGKVRELICINCNLVIGLLKENIKVSKNITKYLEKHK